jgi:hypothetical protein
MRIKKTLKTGIFLAGILLFAFLTVRYVQYARARNDLVAFLKDSLFSIDFKDYTGGQAVYTIENNEFISLDSDLNVESLLIIDKEEKILSVVDSIQGKIGFTFWPLNFQEFPLLLSIPGHFKNRKIIELNHFNSKLCVGDKFSYNDIAIYNIRNLIKVDKADFFVYRGIQSGDLQIEMQSSK